MYIIYFKLVISVLQNWPLQSIVRLNCGRWAFICVPTASLRFPVARNCALFNCLGEGIIVIITWSIRPICQAEYRYGEGTTFSFLHWKGQISWRKLSCNLMAVKLAFSLYRTTFYIVNINCTKTPKLKSAGSSKSWKLCTKVSRIL